MLQIQPLYKAGKDWADLAERESLVYEALELFTPPYNNDETLYRPCFQWYQESGRAASVHGAFIDVNPASGDGAFRSLSRRRCRESCAAAAELGAKNVVFHSSCFPFLRGAYLDGWAGACADFYQELAETYPVRIFIENSPDLDPQPIRELMRRIPDRRVGVCLDFGHAHYSRVPLSGWFDALGDRIGYLHLSDNNGAYDDHLPLGAGTVDWGEADRLRRGLAGEIPMTLEVGPISGVAQSLAYLREHGYFGAE